MKTRTLVVSASLGLALCVTAGPAHAHIQLDSPTPHFVFSNDGIETSPCGSGTPSNAVNPPLTGGATLTVKWHETINHDGHYRIGLSANQSDFTVPTSLAIPTTLPSWDLADGIPDTSKGDGTFTKDITIPNMNCPHCVLQVVQIASLSSDGSNSGGYYTNYYECADLVITASGGTGVGGASGTGGSTGVGGAKGTGGGTGTGAGTGGTKAGTGGAISGGTGGSITTGTGGFFGTDNGTGGLTGNDGNGGATGAGGAAAAAGTGGSTKPSDTSGGAGCAYAGSVRHGAWYAPAAAVLALFLVSARRRTKRSRRL